MMLSMQNFSLDDAGLQRYCRDLMAMNFVCRDTAKLLEMTAEAEVLAGTTCNLLIGCWRVG